MLGNKVEPSERLSSEDLRKIRRTYEGRETRQAGGVRVFLLAVFAVVAVLTGSAVLLEVFQPVSDQLAPQLIASS